MSNLLIRIRQRLNSLCLCWWSHIFIARPTRDTMFAKLVSGLILGYNLLISVDIVQSLFIPYLVSLCYDAMLWVLKALSLREVLHN